MTCRRCDGSGFLNIHQLPEGVEALDAINEWKIAHPDSDLQICDCCGDGEGWYGEPGEHYQGGDHPGPNGPYAYNGGLPECS
jgi:hypothetical protein